ncbi:MAG: CHC2 zinc finger domain-containing protein [Candidatus Competibacter sp.]
MSKALALALSIRIGADTHSGAETMKEGDEGWLDFKAIKEKTDVRLVLSHFGLLEHLEERGAEFIGWCPFGDEHGKKDSFSINVEKKTFQCFACKARGSVLDFVAKFRNANLRESAQWVLSLTNGDEPREKPKEGRPYGKSQTDSGVRENGAEIGEPARNASPARRSYASSVADGRNDAGEEIPPVMSFSLASRLIIANAINPAHLLVVNMDAAGIEWKKAKKE